MTTLKIIGDDPECEIFVLSQERPTWIVVICHVDRTMLQMQIDMMYPPDRRLLKLLAQQPHLAARFLAGKTMPTRKKERISLMREAIDQGAQLELRP